MSAPTIVLGAGFGGLAAAVELARRGVEVIVIEQAAAPGGKARNIEVGDRTIDVGPTVLTMRWVFDALFERAGRRLDDAVTLTPSELIARHSFDDGSRLDLFPDVAASSDAIAAFAGAREAAAYERFAARSEDIAATVRGPFLESERPSVAGLLSAGLRRLVQIDAHRTMWKALSSTFADPRLRALFARYATYVGSSPFEAPATMNLIAHVEREGVAIVEGGMSRLATAVASLASDLGVVFRYETVAREVVARGGRVVGVATDSGMLEAGAVIANADVATLASGALGSAAAGAVSATNRRRRSLSALTWAIVAETSGFPLTHHNVFFGEDYAAEHHDLWTERRLPRDPTVYICAQDRPAQGAARPEGDERLFVIVNAPAIADDAPISREEVDRCEHSMRQRLAKAGLEIAQKAAVVTTPSHFERLAPGTGGAIYGEAAHGPLSALSRPSSRTRLPGLFLAGGSAHPGPGVPMAALSGRTAANAALDYLGGMARSRSVAIRGSTSMA